MRRAATANRPESLHVEAAASLQTSRMNERRLLHWLLIMLIVALILNFGAMFVMLWQH